MGNNVIPYANMVGEKYTYFLYNRYKFIENDKIEEGTLLNATNNSLDPYDYHVEKCGVHSSEKLERRLVHTFSLITEKIKIKIKMGVKRMKMKDI